MPCAATDWPRRTGARRAPLGLVLTSAHLWHNRPGVDLNGVWQPAPGRGAPPACRPGPLRAGGVEAVLAAPGHLQLNTELGARFASYALTADGVARPQGRVRRADAGAAARGSADQGRRRRGGVPRRRLPRRRRGDDPALREEVDADAHAEGVLRVAELLETPGDRRAEPHRPASRTPAVEEGAAGPLEARRGRGGSRSARRTCPCSRAS